MRIIEDHISKSLKKVIRKQASISNGPFIKSGFTGIRPEIFVHASELIDFDGILADGTHTRRVPAQGPSTYKGFEEDRPGRIVVKIICVGGNYSLIQDICGIVCPAVLLSLQLFPKIPLGKLPDGSTKLYFEDYTRNLHSETLDHIVDGDLTFFQGELIFYLTGFIHIWVTKKGGFKSKSTSRSKIKTSRITSRKLKKPSG